MDSKLVIVSPLELKAIVADAISASIKHEFPKISSPTVAVEPDRFITKKEVATLFGVSEVSVWDWEKKGLLTGYRIGNLVRYKYSEVMASPKMIQRGGAV